MRDAKSGDEEQSGRDDQVLSRPLFATLEHAADVRDRRKAEHREDECSLVHPGRVRPDILMSAHRERDNKVDPNLPFVACRENSNHTQFSPKDGASSDQESLKL